MVFRENHPICPSVRFSFENGGQYRDRDQHTVRHSVLFLAGFGITIVFAKDQAAEFLPVDLPLIGVSPVLLLLF